MKYIVIIPAYNEAAYLAKTLQSLALQTLLPEWVLVVNDSSTDQTAAIVEEFTTQYPWLHLTTKLSASIHLPGGKY